MTAAENYTLVADRSTATARFTVVRGGENGVVILFFHSVPEPKAQIELDSNFTFDSH